MKIKYLWPILFFSAGLLAVSPGLAHSHGDDDDASDDMSSDSANDALPSDFKGEVTYKGYYDGTVEIPGRGSHVRIGGFGFSVPSTNTRDVSGDYLLTIHFDGDTITGSVRMTGGLNGGSFRGDRSGAHCRTYGNGSASNFYCGRSSARGSFDYETSNGQRISYRAHADETQIVDDAQIAAQQARQRAEQERQLKLAEARIAHDPLARRLDAIIRQDSQSWLLWHYDIASVTDVRKGAARGGGEILSGNYTYNGGSSGSVVVRLSGSGVKCLQFWNEPACRALGHPASHGIAAGIIGSMFSGGGSDSGGSRDDGGAGYHAWCQQQNSDGNTMSGCP